MRHLHEMDNLVPALLKLIESVNKYSQNPIVCDEVLLKWSKLQRSEKTAQLEKASKAVDRILSLWGDNETINITDGQSLVKPHKTRANQRYSNDNTIVHIAASIGDAALMRAVLALKKINMNHPNYNGDTPLHLAIIHGHTDVAYILISYFKFDMNKENADGLTPLGMALFMGRSDLEMKLLLYPEIDTNWRNKYGNTILHMAAANNRIAAVNELLRRGGKDINAVNNNGETPLDMAVRHGHTQVVKALVRCPNIDREKVNQHRYASLGVEAESDCYTPKVLSYRAAAGAFMGLAFVAATATAANLHFGYGRWGTAPYPINEPGFTTESSQAPSPMNP